MPRRLKFNGKDFARKTNTLTEELLFTLFKQKKNSKHIL